VDQVVESKLCRRRGCKVHEMRSRGQCRCRWVSQMSIAPGVVSRKRRRNRGDTRSRWSAKARFLIEAGPSIASVLSADCNCPSDQVQDGDCASEGRASPGSSLTA
jgi:hypothetical protein